MDGFSNLIEFAIALAGFTSIVVVFAHKDEKWNAFDKFRIVNALMGSIGAAFLAAIPSGLDYLGLQDSSLWNVEGMIVAAFILFFIVSVVIRRKRNLTQLQQDQLPKKVVKVLLLLGVVIVVLHGVALAHAIDVSIKALSYFGIIYLLLISTFAFSRLLFYRPIDHQ